MLQLIINSDGGKRVFRRIVPAVAVVMALGACVPRSAEPVGAPVADPQAVATELQRASIPGSPRQVTFGWTLDEAGARLRGQGVARLEAPERLRVDLFGPRGETYLSAALVGDSFRIPPAAAAQITLPSPTLLWGAHGVVRPPTGARLLGATATEQELVVRYADADEDVFEYRAQSGAETAPRLTRLERTRRGRVVESVQLIWSATGEVEQVRYRDWAAYRDLVLAMESIANVSAFPPAIWDPAGAGR